ncbi:MAG: 50S ribosomal protein L3 [Candidatus Omnitrophota bacterium]
MSLLGKKIGMTQIFDEQGNFVPVTLVEAGPCPILALRGKNILLGYGNRKESRVGKPALGFFKKVGVAPQEIIKEVRVEDLTRYKVKQELKVDEFKPGDFVDISGVSIGKGFQGGVRRWHWRGGPKTHGSTSHRRVGSIGASSDPSRVFKGQHMPGHMGARRTTTQNLKVVSVDLSENILAIKGAVPGHKNGLLVVRKAIKVH